MKALLPANWRNGFLQLLGWVAAGWMLLSMWPGATRWLPPLPIAWAHTDTRPAAATPFVTPLAGEPTAAAAWATSVASATMAPATDAGADLASGGRVYTTQAGDSLAALAARFAVAPEAIRRMDGKPLPRQGFLPPGLELWLPPEGAHGETPAYRVLPDSEVVYSPSTVDFDPLAFTRAAGGALATYHEYLPTPGTLSGGELVAYIARNYSINPRLLLALLEYRGHWLTGQPDEAIQANPLQRPLEEGRQSERLSQALIWAAEQLSIGYYGWREGRLLEIAFPDGQRRRLEPSLNAGTVALMYLFAQWLPPAAWEQALSPTRADGFPAFYAALLGDPWERARWAEPLYPPDLQQPPFILPFARGQWWSLSSGPHGAYGPVGSLAALDLAPAHEGGKRCRVSRYWALAVADGVVVRSEPGIVVLDLDGDGREQTGWNVLYLHLSSEERAVRVGDRVRQGDPLGHPSCEGGVSTGTHVHLARKYNGEWMAADGPVPFNLGGWIAQAGAKPYEGRLVRGDEVVVASPLGLPTALITRGPNDP